MFLKKGERTLGKVGQKEIKFVVASIWEAQILAEKCVNA
jgi:hypothetical protein